MSIEQTTEFFSFTIDTKHTIWVRNRVKIEAETFEKAQEYMIENYSDILNDNIHDNAEISYGAEYLFETCEMMSPKNNSDSPTVEIFKEPESVLIWDNTGEV